MFDPRAIPLLEDVLESMNDAILVDKDNTILFFSESYARDLGISSADALGRDVRDVITNTRMHHVLESGQPESAEGFTAKHIAADGSNNRVSLSPYHLCNRIPVRKNGAEQGDVIAAFAYTALSNQEDLLKATRQLDHMRRENKMFSDAISDLYQTDHALDHLIGSSPEMHRLKQYIRKIAASTITVTVTGETGTGKEVVTSAIHEASPRSKKPFIKINCAAIPESLLESELFGYEPGAFTGASRNGKMGKFELANGGTILLDEIGEMPLVLQAKLLRVLQEQEIERVGGKAPVPIDVRVLCSTNRNLAALVKEGSFRQDLYYRLNVMTVSIPPLRERLDDLPELCEYFIEKCQEKKLGSIRAINPSVYALLRSYSWPGNVRELEHVIECAAVIAETDVLQLSDFSFLKNRIQEHASVLPSETALSMPEASTIPTAADMSDSSPNANQYAGISETVSSSVIYEELLAQQLQKERDLILRTLAANRHNITRAAHDLGISRSTLYRRMKTLQI